LYVNVKQQRYKKYCEKPHFFVNPRLSCGALSGQYIHRKTMVTNNNGDACSVLSSLPLCMFTLNISNLHPIACNEMFVRVIGPLTKFADADFVKTACCDDKQHAESRSRIQSAIDNLVGSSELEKRKRVRDIEITTLCDENSGFPIRRRFDWFISKNSEDPETIIMLGDP
jgi:hypothetical protein